MKHRATTLVLALALLVPLETSRAAQSAEEYYNQALSKQQAGEFRESVHLYTKAIDRDSTMIMAYQMRGAAWHKLRQFRQAFDDYTVLIEQGEPYFQAVGHFNRGIINIITNRYNEAIDDFSDALKIDRKMSAAYFHRALARLKSSDSTGSFQDLAKAARLGHNDAKQWLDLLSPGWRDPKP